MKNSFLGRDFFRKSVFVIIVLLFISPKLSLIVFILLAGIFYLFRSPSYVKMDRGQLNQNMIFSPVSGVYLGEKEIKGKRQILIRIPFFSVYSILMPFGGEVVNYEAYGKEKKYKSGLRLSGHKIQVVLRAKKTSNMIKLKFKSATKFRAARLWCRSGDRSNIGATLGYLPFGGKIVIELPMKAKVLVKENEYIHACDSIIASVED